MTEIRTRFAPSPTGYIHVGNVRSALFSYLLARQHGGEFILRIEDTDQARFVPGATELIFETLKWLGMEWDEGPERGGEYGPYIQTERKEHYLQWGQKLIDKGLAYADPYSEAEIEKFRAQARANKKPFLYRNYRPDSIDSNSFVWDGKQPIRFKVSNPKRWTWSDPVMGDLSAGPEALDDFILIKSDGLPTYNFAHVIDDIEMKITHVIRGLEFIPSIPKYLSLYEALGIEPPVFACVPHVMAPDGKKKLGKRDGAKNVLDYRAEGILPEAMLNFIASLGWNDGTEQEIFSLEELISKFSLNRVHRSGAIFDEKRLLWTNGQWIRRLTLDDLYQRVESFWNNSAKNADESYKKQVLAIVQDRLKTLADLPLMTSYFFEEPEINYDLISTDKKLGKIPTSELKQLLETTYSELQSSSYEAADLQETLNSLLEKTNSKPMVLFGLIRLAISWTPFSPTLNETLAVLGREKVLKRLEKTIKSL